MLAAWPGGSWQDTMWLIVALGVAYCLVLWLSALAWIYRDVKSRTNDHVSQVVSVLLVLIFNLPGLFLYFILRPQETMTEAYERSLETEAMMQELERLGTCPSCRRRIEDEYLLCPYCRTSLRRPCNQCGRALSFGWVACPYCGADRIPSATTQAAQPQTQAASPAEGSPPLTPAPPRRTRTTGLPANTEPLP